MPRTTSALARNNTKKPHGIARAVFVMEKGTEKDCTVRAVLFAYLKLTPQLELELILEYSRIIVLCLTTLYR